MYIMYVCITSLIKNFLFSVCSSPSNEGLPDSSSRQESFIEVQDEVED